MIEIRTYPEDEMIYIDFGYMGIPENIPIEEIRIRAPPSSFGSASDVGGEGEGEGEADAGFLTMGMDAVHQEDLSPLAERRRQRQLARGVNTAGEAAIAQPSGESEYTVLSSSAQPPRAEGATFAIREKLRSILIDADQIQVGEELGVLIQTVDIPDENRRFNLDKQCDDLLDTLLTNITAT